VMGPEKAGDLTLLCGHYSSSRNHCALLWHLYLARRKKASNTKHTG
jgi:hypothetical protein